MSDEPFSEPGFWAKLARHATQAGRALVEKALCLYYAAQRPETPAWAKAVVYGALAYFISPIDAVPDLSPVIGYVDDLGVIAAALGMISLYVDDGVRAQAARKLADWFN